jgi:hypothetical protein
MGIPKVLSLMFHGVVDEIPDYATFEMEWMIDR